MENLNKENFWNSMKGKYPKAMEHFCDWIDEYKKKVNWSSLFGDNIKFHDIPFEMQNGIIAKYEVEFYFADQVESFSLRKRQIEELLRRKEMKMLGKKAYFEQKMNKEQGN